MFLKWAIPLTLIYLAIALMFAFVLPSESEGCTTDTDCMERYGGNGDPEPINWIEERRA